MTSPLPQNSSSDPAETHQGEDRRDGPRDRRKGEKDRRDPERVADEIAPRRHPDIKGRRDYDKR